MKHINRAGNGALHKLAFRLQPYTPLLDSRESMMRGY